MASYEIEMNGEPGPVDVRRDGRAFKYDLDDVEEAVEMIKRDPRTVPGDEVVVIEPDGYRQRVRL